MAGKPLYDQMSALLAYANGITGASDTKLGDAVHTLADGYGQGGGSGGNQDVDVIYDGNVDINCTSTSVVSVATVSVPKSVVNYPIVIMELTNTDLTTRAKKFIKHCTMFANKGYKSGSVNEGHVGIQVYYDSKSSLASATGMSTGLFPYSYTANGSVDIRGRLYTYYYDDLIGTFNLRVIGIKHII